MPPRRLATWNPASSVWEATESHLCGHSAAYSETWPISGMTRRGVAYELPTWAPRTAGSACSSSPGLLPTPAAHDSGNSPESHLRKTPGRRKVTSLQVMVDHGLLATGGCLAITLLPTPRAGDGEKGGPNQRGSSGDLMLPSAVLLRPTPTVMDHKASGGNPQTTGTHRTTLTEATVRQRDRFGAYAPAIARWERVLERPAPPPTEPTGRDSTHRLSPRFVEFLMGLPDGWVTGVPGLTRNDQLKALGNGCVPQQVAAAIQWLLGVKATS